MIPVGFEFYDQGELDDGAWLNPPVEANCVIITAELNFLYWRDDGVLPLPGHRILDTKHIVYHGSKLNHVTLRGSGRAAVSYYKV
jgi:hypothetical protein